MPPDRLEGLRNRLSHCGRFAVRAPLPDPFRVRERQQGQHRRSARKGFGNPLHERKTLRSGEQPLARFSLLINVGFDIGKKLRHVLDFIEDGGRAVLPEEADRVFPGAQPDIRVFKTDEGVGFRKKLFEQGGFPGLPGAGKNHRRKGPDRFGDHHIFNI